MSGPVWTEEQRAIFEDVRTGTGNTVVEAYAGTGKTTTIVEALKYIPRGSSATLCAFNTAIKDELKARAPKGVNVSTLHSMGFSALRNAGHARVDVNKDKGEDIARAVSCKNPLEVQPWERQHVNAVKKAAAWCKSTLASTPEEIDAALDAADLDPPNGQPREVFVQRVSRALDLAKERRTSVDFDDMVWLPVVLGLVPDPSSFVFVDERQDMNLAQLKLALAACDLDGRICAIGDTRQAIYGFRGAAGADATTILAGLDAKVFPLSTTYRCAKRIVAEANAWCPGLRAAPDAPEGTVERIEGLDAVATAARPGDFVISRTNAPLVAVCLRLVAQGKKVAIAGRDIGARLTGLIAKSKARDVGALLDWIDAWRAKEVERLEKRDRPTQSVEDAAACIHSLAEGVQTVDAVKNLVQSMFVDGDDKSRVVCTTTHKAKGLERERVIVLRDTFLRPRKDKKTGTWHVPQEETNLAYVSVSRAKRELFYAYGVR